MKNRHAGRTRVEAIARAIRIAATLALAAACGTPSAAGPQLPFGDAGTDTTTNPATGEDDASAATPSPPTGGIDAGTPPADCSRAESEAQRILSERCASCHGNGASQGGFSSVLDVDALLRQGRVVPNDPAGSPLFRLVEAGAMPKGGPRLSADEVAALRAWIACGASAPGGAVEDDAGGAPQDDAGVGPPDADDNDDDDDDDDDVDEDLDEAADADEDLDEAQEEAAEGDDD